MTKIIGLSGPIGCGKSTVAQSLQLVATGHGKTVQVISFAKPIKDMMSALLTAGGCSPVHAAHLIYEQAGKETPVDVLQGKTPRYAMQTLGTEWGRDLFGPNFWTDIAMAQIGAVDVDVAIIDDVRFPSEQACIEDHGGLVVRLKRDGVEYDMSHSSEQVLSCTTVVNTEDSVMAVADTIYRMAKV